MLSQGIDPGGNQLPVISVKRRGSDSLGQARERHIANDQAVILHRELGHGRVLWMGGFHVYAVMKACSNAVARLLRSIFPFGLRFNKKCRYFI